MCRQQASRPASHTCAHYSRPGVIKESGKKFWSTKDPGQQPFTCQYGVGQVITGWDQGCLGMKIGEQPRPAA